MRFKLIFALSFFLVSACATTASSNLSVSSEVRRASQADDRLFRDMLMGFGGVGFVDRVFYPNAQQSIVIRIEIVSPYSPEQTGSERWYIQHDGADTAVYLITFTPDGQGGTYFSTEHERPASQAGSQ